MTLTVKKYLLQIPIDERLYLCINMPHVTPKKDTQESCIADML